MLITIHDRGFQISFLIGGEMSRDIYAFVLIYRGYGQSEQQPSHRPPSVI